MPDPVSTGIAVAGAAVGIASYLSTRGDKKAERGLQERHARFEEWTASIDRAEGKADRLEVKLDALAKRHESLVDKHDEALNEIGRLRVMVRECREREANLIERIEAIEAEERREEAERQAHREAANTLHRRMSDPLPPQETE